MHVQMIDGLAGLDALIDDQPITAGQPFLFGNLACGVEEVLMVASSGHVGDARNLRSRHDEDMNRRLRIDIPKRNTVLVLVDDVRRNLTGDDLGEQRRQGYAPLPNTSDTLCPPNPKEFDSA